jgi:hypothetical protein
MFDFEGTETPGKGAVNFLHFSYDFVLVYLSTMKILFIEVYCIRTNK